MILRIVLFFLLPGALFMTCAAFQGARQVTMPGKSVSTDDLAFPASSSPHLVNPTRKQSVRGVAGLQKQKKLWAREVQTSAKMKGLIGSTTKSEKSGVAGKKSNVFDLNKYHHDQFEQPSLNADYHGPVTHPGFLTDGSPLKTGRGPELSEHQVGAQTYQRIQEFGRVLQEIKGKKEVVAKLKPAPVDAKELNLSEIVGMDYRSPRKRNPVHN